MLPRPVTGVTPCAAAANPVSPAFFRGRGASLLIVSWRNGRNSAEPRQPRDESDEARVSFAPGVPAAAKGRSMLKTAAVVREEPPFILSSLSPSRAQKRLALAVVFALRSPFYHGRGALDRPPGADRRLHPGLCHGDLRERFDHRCSAVCPVLDPAFARASRDRQRISLHCAHRLPWLLTFPGVFTPAGLLGAGLRSTSWLYPCGTAVFPVRDRLCAAEGSRSGQAIVAALRGRGRPFECRDDRGRRMRRDVFCHGGGCAFAAHDLDPLIFPGSGFVLLGLSAAERRLPSWCSGFGGVRCSICG